MYIRVWQEQAEPVRLSVSFSVDVPSPEVADIILLANDMCCHHKSGTPRHHHLLDHTSLWLVHPLSWTRRGG